MYASLYVFRVKKIIFNACEKRVGTRSRDVHFAVHSRLPVERASDRLIEPLLCGKPDDRDELSYMSAFAVAIGCKADMACCNAYVCF